MFIGSRLRQAIELKGITQKQLCDATGIAEASMSRYISGKRQPSTEVVIALCKELGVSADWLLGVGQ